MFQTADKGARRPAEQRSRFPLPGFDSERKFAVGGTHARARLQTQPDGGILQRFNSRMQSGSEASDFIKK